MERVAIILDVITIILLLILFIRLPSGDPPALREWSQGSGFPPTPDPNYRGPGSVQKPVQGKSR